MNKINIFPHLLLVALFFGMSALTAQTYTGNTGGIIPGSTDGFYCSNAAVSTLTVPMNGRIGVNYEITEVAINVTHEFPAEMQLSLVSPRGNILNLSIANGGPIDGAYQATVFRDGGNDIGNSITPFNSNSGYEPQGNTFADQFDNELVAGTWTLEICDLANNANGGVINGFSMTLNELMPPSPDPVYDIQVSATSFININLNAQCQSMLVPSQILNGNFDLDGDGNIPPDEAYYITVMDEDPCNGPIVDGCGDFEVWISAADTMPIVEDGFDGCSMMNILEFTSVPLPATGQFADVDVTADTIALTTLGGTQFSSAVQAGFSYTFDRSGIAGFRINFTNAPFGPFDLDVVMIDFAGTETDVDLSLSSINGVYTFAQPLEVNPGERLQITLANQDGASTTGDEPSVAKIFDFFFIPTVAETSIVGTSLPLVSFVNAADATPASIVSVPNQTGILFTSQVSDVLVNGLSPSISRSYRVDGQTGAILNNSLDPEILSRLNLAGGLPLVFDGCSDVEIMINDQITSAGNCADIVVTRTFAANDDPDCLSSEGGQGPILATQTITFSRPSLANVNPPAPIVEISCNDFSGLENPLPQLSNFPTLQTANGTIFLDQTVANVGVTFDDGPRITTCDNTFKFVRSFSVVDWCDIDTIAVFNQLVKVGDFNAPSITPPVQDLDFDGQADEGPLVFSTNALNCTAFFDVTSGVTLDDDCSDVENLSLIGYIYPDGDLDAFPLGPFSSSDLAANIPPGLHILQYIASDLCGNADTVNTQVMIADLNAPTAICEDGLNISLNGVGSAVLMAVDINAASIDDCAGTDLLYEIAFVDEDNNPISEWMPNLNLDCTNMGNLRVGLRVTDDGNMDGVNTPGVDNSNMCFTMILVEDQNNPICIAPTSQIIACSDLEGNFPSDVEAAFAVDPEETIALLNSTFGAPNGVDNCPGLTITQTVTDNRTDCGTGTIFRSFGVMDAQGFTALPNCNQTVTIAGSYNYSVVFPADQNNVGCAQPSFSDVSVIEGGCDMITVGMNIDTFTANVNGCRLYRTTFEILNLCEYSTTSPAYEIPRDADGDGIAGEAIVLHVTPGQNSASIADDIAIIDRDLNRNNGNSITNLDTGDGGPVNGSNIGGYGQDASRGSFTYAQFITVTDDVAPVISIDNENDVAMDTNGDCEADLEINFNISDECSMEEVGITADVDLFVNDANQDGTFTINEFIPSFTINSNDIVNETGIGNFSTMLESLPIGRHAIRIRANDGCGNTDSELFIFTAEDMTAFSPQCINGLTVTLAPDEAGGGIAQVDAEAFVVDIDSQIDCSGPVAFAIYRISDATAPGFQPSTNDDILIVNCDDVGDLGIRVYAIDGAGMTEFCETSLLVQVNDEEICNPGGNDPFSVAIAGAISTPLQQNLEGIEVNISAVSMGEFLTFTNTNGNYAFQNLMFGDDYTIEPTANPAIDLGRVTTGDLILISRHILAIHAFDQPYQYVAADVNGDRNINILDMIAIRRVILGLTNDFPATNSWKFISVSHQFGDEPSDWLMDDLMSVHTINNLDGNMLTANFMAIEMGDVSGATMNDDNLNGGDDARSVSLLQIPVASVAAGEEFEIQIPQPRHLMGFQTTLELDSELELVGIDYGTASEGDFNLTYAENGLIGIAHVNQPLDDESEELPLFTLRLRANTASTLDQLLQLSDRLVMTEAYVQEASGPTVTDLELDFTLTAEVEEAVANISVEQLRVDQNHPNPFRDETAIDFYLPVASEVAMSVRDQSGRLLLKRRIEGIAGLNTLRIRRDELGESSGLLYYTVATKAGTITRKMLLVQ